MDKKTYNNRIMLDFSSIGVEITLYISLVTKNALIYVLVKPMLEPMTAWMFLKK